jgi:transcriptional regulator with XRE-family HTH domain
VIKREVKLETMLHTLIERGGYSRNRQPILDSIHVTAAALSQYTRGRTRPSFDKLVALADFFDVPLDYLVYGEPASTPIDPAPITRYVERALMDMRARTTRHAELVAHMGRRLIAHMNEVAHEVLESRSAGIEGLIEISELVTVEGYCQQADIVVPDLRSDIITIREGEVAPGEFFPVVVDNLTHGCMYRFLLAGDLTTESSIVRRFREMISDAVGGGRRSALRALLLPNDDMARGGRRSPVQTGHIDLQEERSGTFHTVQQIPTRRRMVGLSQPAERRRDRRDADGAAPRRTSPKSFRHLMERGAYVATHREPRSVTGVPLAARASIRD